MKLFKACQTTNVQLYLLPCQMSPLIYQPHLLVILPGRQLFVDLLPERLPLQRFFQDPQP